MSEREDEHEYLRTLFLERLAHELRGPAGVIQGVLQELETVLGPDASKHAALLGIARRGVRRILRQADRLQQTGQFERGSSPMERGKCDLAALLRTVTQEVQTFEGRRGIEMDVLASDHPVTALVDARWLGVVVYELASNALRHARAHVRVELIEADDQLVISVRDDNPSPTPFGPTRFRSTREQRGLGLSLAIVQDVAAAHAGTLTFSRHEAPTPGSEARFSLPRSDRAQGTAAPKT